jgi:hypothetical protein
MTFDVRDFGGVGDGRQLQTAAIQRAVDECHVHGGGTVVLSGGTYLSGTISLRSGVTFSVDSSAILRGSLDNADYHPPADLTVEVVQQSRLGLLVASGAHDVTITGSGIIDGNGASFDVRGTIGRRPNLLTLVDCANVTISGLQMRNAAVYTCLLVGCSSVVVQGLRIDSRVRANNDGIDLSSCEDVVISDCIICTSDDAIALKNDIHKICRNIAVSNCILSSRWAAIRIGPESFSGYENITVSNCIIHDTYGCGIKLQMAEGAIMKDLLFSNLVMSNVTGPISIRLNQWENAERPHGLRAAGQLKNVLIQNVRATIAPNAVGHPFPEHTFQGSQSRTAKGADGRDRPEEPEAEDGWIVLPPGWTAEGEKRSCISIVGSPQACIENITLSNLHITFPGGGTREDASRLDLPERETEYPEYFMFGTLPSYGLYARHVRDLALDNIRFDLETQDHRSAVVADDVSGLRIWALRTSALESSAVVIRLRNTAGTSIERCRIGSSSEAFVSAEGEKDEDALRLVENLLERIPSGGQGL